jgi:SulP family sulfate permease
MTVGTVVGEMGFFRKQPRAASVVAEEAAVVYVLSRAAYDRLMAVDAPTGTAFLQFVIRALADRVDGSNREIAALL